MRPLAWLIVAMALVHSTATVDAETLTCSTWQGITTCSSPDGYLSQEWDRDGMTIGQDNQGDRWTTSRWRDIDITTVRRPDRRSA
jgi:hypothetical protein